MATITRKPSRPSAVRQLADRVGIIPEYLDQTGKETRVCTDATRVALLAALGIDASSAALAREALQALEAADVDRLLEPVTVVRRDDHRAAVRLRLPSEWAGVVDWSLELREEGGRTLRREGRARKRRDGTLALPVPDERELGYHTLRVHVRRDGAEHDGEQSLIVVPDACPRVEERLGGRRVFGVIANLYTVRSMRNWGVGNLTDLAELAAWGGETGAAFVGVNPLHALLNRGGDVSPYSPVSRLFRNPIYLDVAALPEFAESPEARARLAASDFRDELKRLVAGDRVEYERIAALQRPLLEALHRVFAERHRGRGTPRGEAFARYVKEQPALEDFATWMALEEHFTARGTAASWREWPAEYHDPRSSAVSRFRAEHAEAVDLHRWLQFAVDEQLAAAAERARRAGLEIGLYQDLAIGTSPSGSDTWSFGELFVQGAAVGAPPDPYSAEGQNWGLPPIDPRKLREGRYRYWIQLVRSSLRHAGALRIDHVMGLFRQFWIPEGESGKRGAYVRFPSDDLLGILALESTRSGALVVGEDLGTVPKEVPPALRRWGIMSSKVLYFERTGSGGFKAAKTYAPDSLTTANTHDMPTIAGFWAGRDVELREQVGLSRPREARAARTERERDKQMLLRRLAAEGIIDDTAPPPEGAELRGAVHAFLCRTPAALVGLALDDIAGETEPVNLPGVGPDRFPSWTRRMTLPLEALRSSADVRSALRCEERGRTEERRHG